jgi:2-keto-4-pentenoate hydratase/2-oxohepta-3-ene-1,7-dioic acid hydratase in catechol pathway
MKIICIGRNYSLHAKELGNEVPEQPVIFCKPDTALLKNNEPFYLPEFSQDIHHELELVIKIDKAGKSILPQFASKYYSQITVGIDFTARDVQSHLKQKGLPWELSKAFDGSAAVGRFIPFDHKAESIHFELEVNGQVVQLGNSKDMLFKINDIIAFVSKYFTLKTGDLIFTGTPAGVAAVKIGDHLKASIENETLLAFDIK